MRARELGIRLGNGTPGPLNAITDVAGVRVGHSTLFDEDLESPVRTGVTVIQPRATLARQEPCFAGCHVLNGNGDASGLEWIREAGLLSTPIAITNTHSVGIVRDTLIAVEQDQREDDEVYWCMPVVMETYDGLLNDIWGQHVTDVQVREALDAATDGAVEEGSVGGGTGMICHEFKGGIGTASRWLSEDQGGWVVGALVQANHGQRRELRVDGYPVGRHLGHLDSPFSTHGTPGMGSIVVVIATDAPLLPHQCQRLAQRASIGIARTGGGTEDSSGDIFLAFSTGNEGLPAANYAHKGEVEMPVRMLNNDHITELFVAAAEAVEEAIVNALLAGREMTGKRGEKVLALDAETLLTALDETGWKPRVEELRHAVAEPTDDVAPAHP
ncbi:P1 family peptidase [Pseudomonas sp. RIT623]|uniref:DmpA family aminopeptidase n=1 Tax=Pseudomonas sp. RIT623 TaxID=2559075 RepID=UPI00106FC781|nr:P1 family peptidase [Pseudomonas sp. RIT623]TFF36033.1 S58 family peptidase [Pseudomonas sp. RIT623]